MSTIIDSGNWRWKQPLQSQRKQCFSVQQAHILLLLCFLIPYSMFSFWVLSDFYGRNPFVCFFWPNFSWRTGTKLSKVECVFVTSHLYLRFALIWILWFCTNYCLRRTSCLMDFINLKCPAFSCDKFRY